MMDKEMKSERITLRVSPKEKKEIEKKAAQENMSVSKYLISLTKSEKSLVTDHVADFVSLDFECDKWEEMKNA